MSLPLTLAVSTHEKSSPLAKTVATLVYIIALTMFVLAIYLAVRDMQFLLRTGTKIWVLALAVLFPELYVLLHGVSTSAQGVSFFAGSPMPGSSAPASTSMPDLMGSTADASTGGGFSPGYTPNLG